MGSHEQKFTDHESVHFREFPRNSRVHVVVVQLLNYPKNEHVIFQTSAWRRNTLKLPLLWSESFCSCLYILQVYRCWALNYAQSLSGQVCFAHEGEQTTKTSLLCANLGSDAGVPYAVKRLPPSVSVIADMVLYTRHFSTVTVPKDSFQIAQKEEKKKKRSGWEQVST